MDSINLDDDLAAKGIQALSLTRADSDASVLQLSVVSAPVLRQAVENATDIHRVDVLSFYERIMQARSVHCRHTKHHYCVNNVMAGFFSNFKSGFLGSFILSAIPLILKMKVKLLIKMLLTKEKIIDSCKLALFAGLLNATYKAVLCLIRRLYPADKTERANKIAAPIAGFIAGMTLVFEN
jgi:hypothetical protein